MVLVCCVSLGIFARECRRDVGVPGDGGDSVTMVGVAVLFLRCIFAALMALMRSTCSGEAIGGRGAAVNENSPSISPVDDLLPVFVLGEIGLLVVSWLDP